MLNHLLIHNLAVVESLQLNFEHGMTVLSGETGAGKSILIEALGLALGDRANPSLIRPEAQTAEVQAIFDIYHYSFVKQWLIQNELNENEECIIRRTLTSDGKSRAFINGRAVPLTQLKSLSSLLIDIHGQHQHQSLLKPDFQRVLIDGFANHPDLLSEVKKHFSEWSKIHKELKELNNSNIQQDRLSLLQYQLEELEILNLKLDELNDLESEHKKLSNVDKLLTECQLVLSGLQNDSDEMDAYQLISQLKHKVSNLLPLASTLKNVEELLNNSLILIEESKNELELFIDKLVIDPQRLNFIDNRLSDIHNLARKHKIDPNRLIEHFHQLKQEYSTLKNRQNRILELQNELERAEDLFKTSSHILSLSRKKAALELTEQVLSTMKLLEMPKGRFEVQFTDKNQHPLSSMGMDEIEFLVSVNPGHPLQPLRKVASGGELSRISLAIQVITAKKITTPTLIFDEVDVGISGKTADMVGQLMRKVANNTQVLCVTHLPQVAAYGHNHYKVEKKQTKDKTHTHISLLKKEDKIQEIARMLGGIKITPHAIAHAEEMLESVE
ncbi:MAG: repair protein RecN [Francisellaceae bacterium]|nr:repair protein RecN [Francisellaceae bacterium]